MTQSEGKAFLQDCLAQCQSTADIDTLICCKYGTKEHASAYQTDEIKADVKHSEEKSGIKFIVKCFKHMGIYVAWHVRTGNSNGKYIAYKKDLVSMENEPKPTYKEVVINRNEKAYFFKGREGVIEFMRKNLFCNTPKIS